MDAGQPPPVRPADAGEDRSAWITLLTTEHDNPRTRRAATITETDGRAGVVLSSVSSGPVPLGFAGQGGRDVDGRRVGRRSQRLLTVSGSVGVLNGLLAGGELGLLVNAATGSVPAALAAGAVLGARATAGLMRSQDGECRAALADAG